MKLPLFPLHTVLFPGMPLPLHIFEPRYQAMIQTCLNRQAPFGVVLIRSGPEVGGPAEPHAIGTSASISRVERLPDGRMNIEVVGQERIKILALQHDEAYLTGTVENYPLDGAEDPPAHKSARALAPWLGRYLTLLGEAAGAPFDKKHLPNNPASSLTWPPSLSKFPWKKNRDYSACIPPWNCLTTNAPFIGGRSAWCERSSITVKRIWIRLFQRIESYHLNNRLHRGTMRSLPAGRP